MSEPSAADWEGIDNALYADRPVDATRLYRQATGVGIAAGLAAIEARRAALPPIAPAVAAFLASGFAPAGEVWAQWQNRDGAWCVLTHLAATRGTLSLDVFPARVGNWGQQLNGMTLTLAELDGALTSATGPAGADWSGDHGVRPRLRACLAAAAPVAAVPAPAPAAARVPDACANGSTIFVLDGAIWERDWATRSEVMPRTDWTSCWHAFLAAGNLDPPETEPVEALDGDRVRCTAAAGLVLWERCHAACVRTGHACVGSDSWWSDLEAQPPAWSRLGAEARTAWSLLLALGDAGGRRRELLPWWLGAAAASDGALIGLITPLEARRLGAQDETLRLLFRGHAAAADLDAILRLAESAAAQGRWLLGREAK